MNKKIGVLLISLVVLALVGVSIVYAIDPGSESDPLISKSYIDEVLLPKIYSYIDKALEGISQAQGDSITTETFEVVSIKAGGTIIGNKGCEMILRMGSAVAITSIRGGLADVTGGVDIQSDSAIPPNHLLIVPLDDGRGMKATADTLIMVKGGYRIIE